MIVASKVRLKRHCGDIEMEARDRLIRRSDMVACKVAFIDCKMPGSTAKENYSLIGPGVTQSADQVVNITEAHGFSLGVAAMPAGTTNNLHVHYTAEVFMVFSGTWLFRWGAEGKDGEIIGKAGDVVSIPTWIFRGFSNVGNDDGWIFTALGGDDTGGIIWHPSILKIAAEHGLYLTRDNMLVDTAAGSPKPAPHELIEPLDEATVQGLRRFDTEAMRRRVVARDERAWSSPRAAGQRAGGPCERDGAGDRPWHDPGPGERAEDHQPARVFDGMAAHPAGEQPGRVPAGGEAGPADLRGGGGDHARWRRGGARRCAGGVLGAGRVLAHPGFGGRCGGRDRGADRRRSPEAPRVDSGYPRPGGSSRNGAI
jgi:quercetin dioxygenase-like cupin family protein